MFLMRVNCAFAICSAVMGSNGGQARHQLPAENHQAEHLQHLAKLGRDISEASLEGRRVFRCPEYAD